jgi:hypothetical protein
VVVAASDADELRSLIPEETWIIGTLVNGDASPHRVHLV